MSLSSSWKKIDANKSLAFIFLVGLLSLTFLVFNASKVRAATTQPGAPTSTSAVTAQTVTYSWTTSTGQSAQFWVYASSTNRVPTLAQTVTSTPTSTVGSFVFRGLATNTAYYFGVAAGDFVGATSSYATSSLTYTAADTPGTPTLASASSTGFKVTINSSTNPVATTYVVRDTGGATLQYLQSDQTWGSASSTTFTAVQLGAINGTSTAGLSPDTIHRISVAAVNGDGVTSSFSAAVDITTLAVTPGTPTLTSANPQQITITINSSTNPATTTYVVRDTGTATLQYLQSDQTWGTASNTTFTAVQLGAINGTTSILLATNTIHRISVAAVNGDRVTTTYGTAVDITTLADTPGAPTLSAASLTTFTLRINSSTNPATTTYIIRDTGTSTTRYLQDDHTWTTVTATFKGTQLGPVSGTSTIGLSANTLHTISVAAVNGDSVTSSYGTAASIYTLANAPSSVAVTAGANGLTLSWTGESTLYYAEDITAGLNSGLISALAYSVNGLNCNTTRTFNVRGQNGDGVVTASSSNFSGTTSGCGGSGSGVGGGASVTPAQPAVPGVSPAVPASVTLPSTASSVAVFVHTLRPGSRGGEVRQLQQRLRELGFFKHPVNTDFFGSVTKAALIAFQKAEGLKASGVADADTRAALNGESNAPAASAAASETAVFVHTLGVGSKGEEVRMLQAKLRELGYFNHPTDTGSFGSVTRAALREFQKAQGLSPVGFVGPGTRAALNSL